MRIVRSVMFILAVVLGTILSAGKASAAGTVRLVNGASGTDSGDCSATACKTLVYAVGQAISGDTISIAAGTYQEHLTLAISLTVTGAGAASTTLQAPASSRVLDITAGTTVGISGVTITGGNIVGAPGAAAGGGGVCPSTAGSAAPSVSGGGILNNGTLSIQNSTVSGNSVAGGTGGHGADTNCSVGGAGGAGGNAAGGAIDNENALTIVNSTLSNNSATGGAGGSGGNGQNYGGTGGAGGSASGGAIFNAGTLSLTTTVISGGQSSSAAGGSGTIGGSSGYFGSYGGDGGAASGGDIASQGGSVTMLDSTLTGGSGPSVRGGDGGPALVTVWGGQHGGLGGGASGGGLSATQAATVDIKRSTVSGLQIRAGDGGLGFYGGGNGGVAQGGGLSLLAGSLANSTIGANTVTGGNGGPNTTSQNESNNGPPGNGGDGAGGGLAAGMTGLTLTNDTIARNTATGGLAGTGVPYKQPLPAPTAGMALGGGVFDTASVGTANTILALNVAATGPDCSGTLADAAGGHSLLGDGTGCTGLTNATNGDQVGVSGSPIDPVLGSLKNNGGLTKTMALQAGSPAIDAGDNATCAAAPVNGVDQRTAPRPSGPKCDIGAFELNSNPTVAYVASLSASKIYQTGHGAHRVLHWRLVQSTGVTGFLLFSGSNRLTGHVIAVHASPEYTYNVRATVRATITLHVLLRSGREEVHSFK